jgi:hypothetical protein
MNSACRYSALLLVSFLVLVLASPVAAQEPQSVAPAKQLATMMEQAKLESVAARDAASADTFIAALYFPGQLMVVSAKYSVPILLNEKIMKKEYRDIYNDLNGAAVAGTKVLVMDLGADGLKAKRDEGKAFDTFETSAKMWSFDGDFKGQKISEDEYMKAFADADGRYAKMLLALIAQLKKAGTRP